MRSTFLGFNTARSGLFASQRALDITGHNIANVNTPGYTRQRLDQSASSPMAISGGQGMLGTGVDTRGIEQIRNEFLDIRYRSEVNERGYWNTRREGLQYIEDVFNEPSDTGLSNATDELFESLHELQKSPESLTVRTTVRQNGVAFTNSVNHTYHQLEKMAADTNFQIVNTVNQINTYSLQIARLNEQIYASEMDGSSANDLRDQRNLLIDQLSELVDVEVLEITDGNSKKMVLQLNGQALVSHDKAYLLDASTQEKSEFFEAMGSDVKLNQITWKNSGTSLDVGATNGKLKAMVDLRDGKEESNKGIPYYIKELNHFVETFAKEMNKIHAAGYGSNGEYIDGIGNEEDGGGYLFFTAGGIASENMYDENNNIQHEKITAKNIKISADIDDPNKIAASSNIDFLPGDASQVTKMTELQNNSKMFSQGNPKDFLRSLVSNLGVDAQEAIRNTYNQELLVDQIENNRLSISGVSMDEELSKMVMYQHSYNASARMMTTMDEMLDVIINRLGLVGR
ncbi:MAG: flagellar hook-associated protein FlgK [Clostridiaceae bacterium]|nr:flagellar hook-associated protein FlgK [Clostridiaceae bacterium]